MLASDWGRMARWLVGLSIALAAAAALTGALFESFIWRRAPVNLSRLAPPTHAVRRIAAVGAVIPLIAAVLLYQTSLLERSAYPIADLGSPVTIAVSVAALP